MTCFSYTKRTVKSKSFIPQKTSVRNERDRETISDARKQSPLSTADLPQKKGYSKFAKPKGDVNRRPGTSRREKENGMGNRGKQTRLFVSFLTNVVTAQAQIITPNTVFNV